MRTEALPRAPSAHQEGQPPGQVHAAPVVVSVSLLAAVVVARHLGTKPLWRDEAISVSVATRPLLRVLSVLPHHDANAGLYYSLLHFWLRLGSSTVWARGFSAVCFTAAAGLAGWAASRWWGWEIGLACGLLVATNPFLVYYGQETRPYSLAFLLAVLSTITLFWHGERPAAGWYVATTIALVYVNLFAVLLVAAMAGAVVLVHLRRHQPVPKVLIRGWVAIAGASAPLAGLMLIGEGGQIGWLTRPTVATLVRTWTAMAGGWLGLALMLALAATAAIVTARNRPAEDQVVVAALAAAFAVPIPTLWAVAQVVPSYLERYVICSVVGLIGLVGAGLRVVIDVAGPVAAAAVLVVLLVIGGQHTAQMEAVAFKIDNAPAVVDFINSRSQPGDAIGYAGGGLRILVNASRPGAPTAARFHNPPAFPNDVALAPGGEEFRQHDLYAIEVSPTVLAQRLAGVQRLWLLTDSTDLRYPQDGPFAKLRSLVTGEFTPRASGSFGAVDVTLLVRR